MTDKDLAPFNESTVSIRGSATSFLALRRTRVGADDEFLFRLTSIPSPGQYNLTVSANDSAHRVAVLPLEVTVKVGTEYLRMYK